jgi:AraC-like DNA-binding protein
VDDLFNIRIPGREISQDTKYIISLLLARVGYSFPSRFYFVFKKHNNNNPKSRDALGRFLPFCLFHYIKRYGRLCF